MKASFFSLLAFLFATYSGLQATEPYNYTLQEKVFKSCTYFEMQGKNHQLEGCAVKDECFQIRTSYELYAPDGCYEALAICRLLSLGVAYVWAKEIDVYDANDEKIGSIHGEALTIANAKFSIYDANEQLLGKAYLDYGSSCFVILDPLEETNVLAQLKRNFIPGQADSWDVALYNEAALDRRLLKVFSLFAIDFQEYFKEDL